MPDTSIQVKSLSFCKDYETIPLPPPPKSRRSQTPSSSTSTTRKIIRIKSTASLSSLDENEAEIIEPTNLSPKKKKTSKEGKDRKDVKDRIEGIRSSSVAPSTKDSLFDSDYDDRMEVEYVLSQ